MRRAARGRFDDLEVDRYNDTRFRPTPSGTRRVEGTKRLTSISLWSDRLSKLSRRDGLRFARRQTLAAVGGNGAIDDGTAVDAFPGVEDEKEIRKSLQHHQAFALWTFHVSPPR